jgi:hypothetical protein
MVQCAALIAPYELLQPASGNSAMRFRAAQHAQPSPEAQELLAQLKDIHEPAPIGWWPPAPGWWLLGLLALTLAAIATYLFIRFRRRQARNRYRVEAVRLLRAVDIATPDATAQINEILKRVAVKSFGRAKCANLTGRRWIEFLRNALHESASIELSGRAETALLEQMYRATSASPENSEALREFAICWAKAHSTQYPRQQTIAMAVSNV